MRAAAQEAVPTLLQLLRSDLVSDRKLAAWTLGYIGLGAVEAAPALLQASRDDDQGVRWMAATALEKIAPSTHRAAA
jgi:HEAT repeat protein